MFNRLLDIAPHSTDSFFLFGPRGTGKTTWLKKHFPTQLYFDLLDSETYLVLLASPTRLGDRIPSDYTDWVIIDEVQKVPELLDEVHKLIEHRKLRFILTGSSARKIKRDGVNLLAGRALTYHMHTLTHSELGKEYNFKRALQYGNLPKVIHHDNPKKFLASYVETYLREEVLQEGLIRNLATFTRFLETASFSQGEVINYTDIARDVATNRHNIANYFDILEDLLLAHRLNGFDKRAQRDVITTPKFYYFDVGVYRAIRPRGPLDSPEEIEGPALETLFFQEAKAINDYDDLGYDFHYWRSRAGHEVDFVLYGERGLIAIEIKRKSKLKAADFKSLYVFGEDYPMAKRVILYGGNETYTQKDIQVIPFAKGIEQLPEILS